MFQCNATIQSDCEAAVIAHKLIKKGRAGMFFSTSAWKVEEIGL